MLQLKLRTKNFINFSDIKEFPVQVNTYLYNHLNTVLNKVEIKIADYIYSKLNKKTGTLKKAIRTTNKKTNQYGTEVGFYIDTDVAPYASTVIGKGVKTINMRDKLLTIPFTGTRYKRVTPGMKFNRNIGKYGMWFTGDKEYQFHAQKQVNIRKRVNPDKLSDIFEFEVGYGIGGLLNKAIASIIKK